MSFKPSDDVDLLDKRAAELLQRPENYLAWDRHGQYDTYAPVYVNVINSDDVLSESNWHAMRDALNGAIVHGGREGFEDLHDLRESHWGYGPIDVLYVRVRDECTGIYTPAFREAVDLLESLSDYPILDESDYSEREYKAWELVMDDALDSAARKHEADEAVDEQLFYTLVTFRDEYREALCDGCSPDEVSWERVRDVYDRARNDHYNWLAGRMLAPYVPPGQLSLL